MQGTLATGWNLIPEVLSAINNITPCSKTLDEAAGVQIQLMPDMVAHAAAVPDAQPAICADHAVH